MSKTETLRQSAASSNEIRLEKLASRIEAMRQAKYQSAEELAKELEPLAQALAALADETRQTLAEIERTSQAQAEQFSNQTKAAAKDWREAAAEAQAAADSLNQAGQRMELRHYALAGIVGMVTAALVTACWLWLAPSATIQNTLDPEAVAKHLRPAIIEALKRK